MNFMLKSSLSASLILLLTVPVLATTIDDFSSYYPANPDLPTSGRQIIFVGTKCDGSACPPGAFVSHLTDDSAYQTGLPGVIGGERYALITYFAGTADSGIYPPANSMSHNHNSGATSVLEMVYGYTVDLNADFLAISATKFIVTVTSGDMYAGPRPVPCTITVISERGTVDEATASLTVDLTDTMSYDFPFSAFGSVDFSDIDYISYTFDATGYTSIDYSIGPLMTDGGSVDADTGTWGAIKELYR